MPRNSTFPIAATIAIALLSGCAKPVAEPEPVRPVRSVVVNEGATQATREYAAEIKARTETRLSFQVPGKLVRRMVEVGQSVKLGQPLAQLEPQDAQLSAQAAVAAREGAEANLALAQADLARFKQLKEQGFISGAELERREASLKAARAQADQARAQQTLTSNQAGYTVLLASAAGIVTAVEAEPGMVLAAGTPVLKIAHDGPRDAVIAVPEAEAAAFTQWARNPGQFTVQGWAQQAAAVPAQVREVSASADPATRTFNVKLDVGSTTNLMLGQSATARLSLPSGVSSLRLPVSALTQAQGETHVWVVEPDSMKVRLQKVQIGGAEGNEVLVASGLKAGMRVVTAGVHVLVPGQQVRLWQPSPVAAAAGASAAR
jgi:membrane fusion protein, multidrug efflux system